MRTARVRTANGVPRIEIDGVPTRGRMFYGTAASPTIEVSGERAVEFTFRAPLSTQTATLHFRFGQLACDATIERLEIVEVGTGRPVLDRVDGNFQVWPPPKDGAVGSASFQNNRISVAQRALSPGESWPDFHVHSTQTLRLEKGARYRVRFVARARVPLPLTVAVYEPGTTFTFLGGPPGAFERQIQLASGAGVNFVSFEVAMPWLENPLKAKPGDFAAASAACERVLLANPDALLLPRVPLYPPQSWRETHPPDIQRWDDGEHGGAMVSPLSTAFVRDASANLSALISQLESRFGDRIAGYHPTGQNTGEWFYMDSWTGALPGFAACDRAAWETWRREKGLPPAPVPTPEQRKEKTPSPVVAAFHRFLSEGMADAALAMAKTVRATTGGRKLSLLFYGYVFEFAPMPSGPANSGHYALRRVLDSPDVDILCAPFSYLDRKSGGSGPVMTAAESVALAGKLWLNEDDTRTFLAKERSFPGFDSGADDLRKTAGILRRDLALCLTRNHATWWMDLPGTGWFDDPALWEIVRSFRRFDDDFLKSPTPFRPEIALAVDESSVCFLGPSPQRNAPLSELRQSLGRVGAPYGQYLVDDLLRGRCDAKFWVIAVAQSLTAPIVDAISAAAKKRGATVIFTDDTTPAAGDLRVAARIAGVHLYTQTDSIVLASGPFVALHAVADGPVSVTLKPGEKPVEFLLRRGETRIVSP